MFKELKYPFNIYPLSKEKPIQIRFLRPTDMLQLYRTFIEAFGDYTADMQMDRKAFEKRMLSKLCIDWQLSVGAFSGDKMIGFITHTANQYEGRLTVYNGGTGVIPAYRGNDLTRHMYEAALYHMKQRDIDQCVLEVIVSNARAIRVYEEVGFKIVRRMKCYKLMTPKLQPAGQSRLVLRPFDRMLIGDLQDQFSPSFMDTLDQLEHNKAYEKMFLLFDTADRVVAYLVFQPATGRVARIWVHTDWRNQGIGKSMVTYADFLSKDNSLTVINVDDNADIAHQFLIACGFENQIDQWEMKLVIN